MYPSSLRIRRESYALPRTSSSTLFSLAWRLRRGRRLRGRRAGRMEGQHIVLHTELEPTHAVRFGFLQGPPIGPSIVRDAVAGNHRSGTVRAAAAVYEYRAGGIVHQGDRLRDLFIGRRPEFA